MSTTPATGSRRRFAQWPTFIDGSIDGFLIAFTGWTLFYEIALAAQRSVRWAAWPWMALSAVLIIGCGIVAVRREDRPGSRHGGGSRPSALRLILIGAGLIALTVAVLARGGLGVVPLAVIGIVVLVAQVWPWVRLPGPRTALPPTSEGEGAAAAVPMWQHAVALAVSLGLGALAAFLLRTDADDVFYVNRATWIAARGVPVTHDTMFSPDRLAVPYNGGLPTPSVEALQGTIAHGLGLQAASVAYLVWTPVLSALFGWVTWRLVRAWAPRLQVVVFLVAIAFVLASGSAVVGNYSIGRIWQGKVTAYAVLLPVIWLYLSRLTTAARTRREQLMLLVAGICFVGLTTTSALLGPVIVGAGLLAAAVLRSRALLIGSLALLAAPLVNGIIQVVGPAQVGEADSGAASASQVFDIAFGTAGPLALLGVLGLVLGPRVIPGPRAVVAAMASVAVLAALLPGMLTLADAATNAGAVVWRLAIEAPVGVLVGLLVAAPLPSLATRAGAIRWARLVPAAGIAVVILVVLVASGRWIWSDQAGGRLTSHPTWKIDQAALSDVRAALRLPVQKGRWLLPVTQMQVLAITEDGPYPVVARDYYLPYLDVSARDLRDRQTLLGLVTGQRSPSPTHVRQALRRLDVSLACVPGANASARHTLRAATGHQLRAVGDMACDLEPRPTAGAATPS